MGWDNRVLEVNGSSQQMLKQAIDMAAQQQNSFGIKYWRVERPLGLILLWEKGSVVDPIPNAFMTEMTPDAVVPMVWEWLKDEIENHLGEYNFENEDWFDGSIDNGWHLTGGNGDFTGDNHYRICVIRPERLWYGK